MPDGMKRVFVTGLTDVTTTRKEELGTIRREGNKTYKYVKFLKTTATVAVVAGNVVFYSGFAASEVTADITDIEVAGLAAGHMAAAWDGVTTSYGWIQVRGLVTNPTDVTAGANGNALTAIGAGDKTLDVSAAVTDHCVAQLLDDSTGAQTILATNYPL